MVSMYTDNDKPPAQVSTSSSPNSDDISDDRLGDVSKRYRGTTNDVHDMSVLGKKQVLKVCMPSSPHREHVC